MIFIRNYINFNFYYLNLLYFMSKKYDEYPSQDLDRIKKKNKEKDR